MIIVKCDFCGVTDKTALIYTAKNVNPYYQPYDEELHICRECLNKLRKVIKNEEKATD